MQCRNASTRRRPAAATGLTRIKAPARSGRYAAWRRFPSDARMLLPRLAPVALSSLLLAAHFHRAGAPGFAMLAVASLALLLVRKPWVARILQAALLLGAVEWLRTLATFAAIRMSLGQPYLRMALILGAVALFTALAALSFESRALRERYGLGPRRRATA